jgi:hypothetical protein
LPAVCFSLFVSAIFGTKILEFYQISKDAQKLHEKCIKKLKYFGSTALGPLASSKTLCFHHAANCQRRRRQQAEKQRVGGLSGAVSFCRVNEITAKIFALTNGSQNTSPTR